MTKWIAATVFGALAVVGIPTAVLVTTAPNQATYHGTQARNAIYTQEIGFQPAVSPR